ncbi:acetyltransferase [Sphingomonas sp. IW22]|uniref:acetyltransferase n=1 Tax=Sphingomonas sp. IW22 TaxID=3242489 RepID=UPI00352039C5
MATIRRQRPGEGKRILDIWRDAVDATHAFLSTDDRAALDKMLAGFLPNAPLWVAVDTEDRPVAVMLVEDGHMEALFVAPLWHGRGIGTAMIRHALALHGSLTTDVNEQNRHATHFYERAGFHRIGRSPPDSQGRPYPLIHLRHGDR